MTDQLTFDSRFRFSNGDSFSLDLRRKTADLFRKGDNEIRRLTTLHLDAVFPVKKATILLEDLQGQWTPIVLRQPIRLRKLIDAITTHYSSKIPPQYFTTNDKIHDVFDWMSKSQLKKHLKRFYHLRGDHVFLEGLEEQQPGLFMTMFGS